jgi:tetratricopeptide (TPR) repeat protein
MKRSDAFALVRQHGGTPRRGITKKIDALVVGELGWPLLPDGQPPKSLSQAKSLGVEIVSERRFLEWIGRAVPDDQLRTYDLEQICALSGLPATIIEELDAFGLLDPRAGRYRFRDLTIARQIAELLDSGTALSTITRSLHEIRKWLPDADLSHVRLYPSSKDAIIVEHLKVRSDRSGQMMLPVAESADSPDALFEQAQAAEEGGAIETAERLYRRIMKLDPEDPAAGFNLGNLMAREGRKVEAEAAFRLAIKADQRFPEAWYNLANLLEEQGQAAKAVESLKKAVALDPDYADAIFNLALLLQKTDRLSDAASYWRRYIALDESSPWAARARRALKLCEMQNARSS